MSAKTDIEVAMDIHCVLEAKTNTVTCNSEYEQRLLLRYIHHFKSDLINDMDHMRISGTEPSSVILSQTK